MTTRLLIYDQSKQIQRHLDTHLIEYLDCPLYKSAAEIDSNAASSGADVALVEEHIYAEYLQNYNTSSAPLVIIVRMNGKHSATNQPCSVTSDRYCLIGNINKDYIKLLGTLAELKQENEKLARERFFLREMTDACQDFLGIKDRQGKIIYANTTLSSHFGLQNNEIIGKRYVELTGDYKSSRQINAEDQGILESGTTVNKEAVVYTEGADTRRWNRISKKRIVSPDSMEPFVLTVGTEVTQWKKKESELRESKILYRELYIREQRLRSISSIISSADLTEPMLSQVDTLLRPLFNAQRAGIINSSGEQVSNNVNPYTTRAIENFLDQYPLTHLKTGVLSNDKSIIAIAVTPCNEQQYVFFAINKPQQEFEEKDLELLSAVASQCMVSIARIALNRKLEYQAYHDTLTGLPNRSHFEEQLEQQIDCSFVTGQKFSVLNLDINAFKSINDTYGRSDGDKLLVKIAARLAGHLGPNSFLARVGEDEFNIILNQNSAGDDVRRTCANLLAALKSEIQVESHRFTLGATIGVSRYPVDGKTAAELMRKANNAMYSAKESSSGHIAIFNEEIDKLNSQRLRLETDLSDAIHSNQLEIHYQPQYDLKNRAIIGVEALTRWQHPEFGYIRPDEFIAIAEQSHLIFELGDWVINNALRQAKIWDEQGLFTETAINISTLQCAHPTFASDFLEKIDEYHLDPGLLQVEITESTFMNDVKTVTEQLLELQQRGVKIALDDFGTGYSSLGYLQDLPIDVLKIDRCFVNSMKVDQPQQSLIGVISRMASDLGMRTVVEGVETEAQVDAATKVGCDFAQGWYFNKALPAEDITSLLLESQAVYEFRQSAIVSEV